MHLWGRNLCLRLLYCDLMIKPNKTKTWPSGAAFNISELAAGIQLFSVWIHFPFINISMCINKMKVALQNQKETALHRQADCFHLQVRGQSLPRGFLMWAPIFLSKATSFYRLKTRKMFRHGGELTNNGGEKKGRREKGS